MASNRTTEISVVSPVFMAQDLVSEFVSALTRVLDSQALSYEIILVDDGSTDASWETICLECRKSAGVRGIRIANNSGQHRAVSTGLRHAGGNAVVIMDCDLQDDAAAIGKMYRALCSGFDVVYTLRARREYGPARNLSAALFYGLLSLRYGTRLDPRVGTFVLLSRKAVQRLLDDPLHVEGFLLALRRSGLASTSIETVHRRRPAGRSSYSYGKLLAMAARLVFLRTPGPDPRGAEVAETINL